MTAFNPWIDQLLPKDVAELEEVVARFEAAWQQGQAPVIDAYLTPESVQRQAVLIELVHADLEFRLRAGEPIRVESYLQRYPELRQDRSTVAGLLAAEYSARREREPDLGLEDYLHRFPDYRAELEPRIPPHGEKLAKTLVPSRDTFRLVDTRDGQATGLEASPTPEPSDLAGYEMLEKLGQGAMGVVYKARQKRLGRLVALKMILVGGHANEADLARFQTEAETIARLQHPNIVQIYEVGEHQGKPFLSLEFCAGGSLDRNLAGAPLAPKQAAKLTETLARAVHAAHQANVIHRDLKPANVLLTTDGTPKITDFGLARKTDEAGQTQKGAVMGTPSYMAPEQAQGNQQEGPPADVYALGAILYELLTGQPPFKGATMFDTIRQVVTTEPVPPRQLNAKTPGDLETICLKCLRKDPRQRYATADDLAEDLGRWQRGEPVRARPVSMFARVMKWTRRNPAVAALSLTMALVVLGSLAGLSALYLNAERQRRLAEHQEEGQRAITRFYAHYVLAAARPKGLGGGAGKDVTLKEALDSAVPKIDEAFAGQPELEAAVRNTLGMTYWYLGQFEAANPLLEKAYQIRLERLGADHPETLSSLHDLARQRWRQGKFETGIALCRQALTTRQRVLGAEHPDTLASQLYLGLFLLEKNRFLLDKSQLDEAEDVLRQAIASCKRTLGPDHLATLRGQNDLALVLKYKGKQEEALALDRQTLEGRRRLLGVTHPDTLLSMANLASSLGAVGQLAEAEALCRQCLEGRQRVLGNEHEDTWVCLDNLSGMLQSQGKLAEAEELHRQTLKDCQQLRGPDDPETLMVLTNLGAFLAAHDKLEEAGQHLRQAVEGSRRKLGLDHPSTLIRQNQLAWLLEKQGQTKEAVELYQQTLDAQRRVRGPRHADTLVTQINLTVLLTHEGKKTEAEALHRATLDPPRRFPGPDGPQTPVGGDWRGRWKNSRGETGEERLSLEQKADGTITGVWAWSEISIPIRGERLGRSTFVLQGATKGRFYRGVAIVDDGKLLLHYSASRLNVGGAYHGWSVFTKSK